jgi:hypothetical protein
MLTSKNPNHDNPCRPPLPTGRQALERGGIKFKEGGQGYRTSFTALPFSANYQGLKIQYTFVKLQSLVTFAFPNYRNCKTLKIFLLDRYPAFISSPTFHKGG